jgi:hypothetical protein
MLSVERQQGRSGMNPSDLFGAFRQFGIQYGGGTDELVPILDELEERVWLAQQEGRDPPQWVTTMITAVEQRLGSAMEIT